MRTGAARSVADFIAAQPPPARAALRRVCAAIRKAVPEAVGSIAYGMPVFRLDGRPLLYVGAWKAHYSLYPSSDRLIAALGDAAAPFARSKGTIKFPLDAPVPVALIARIAAIRRTLLAGEAAAPRARRRKARVGGRRGAASPR